jgi:hypothetical protein
VMWTRPVATTGVAGYEGYFVDTDGNVLSELGSRFESAAAAQTYGFLACQICKVCRGVKKSHAGYVWRYEE